MNAWAKDSVSNALGIVLHFLIGNLSKELDPNSNQSKPQKNSKSIKECCGPLLGNSATSRWRKIEEITLSCAMIGKISLDISGTPLFSFHCFLLTAKQTFFFFLHILGSIGSGNLKWINHTLQIYHEHYSCLCAKGSSTIVVCSKRDVWWLISVMDAVHLALLPA